MAGRERFAEINARRVDVFNHAKIPQFTQDALNELKEIEYPVYTLR